jgi:hypothetical protein
MHLRGKSVSIFDVTAGKWKQTWIDNEGGYLDFVGESKDGQMILAREATRPDGTKGLSRMVFKNITHDEFDWSWEGSKDGGKTWTVVWPIHYKRRPQMVTGFFSACRCQQQTDSDADTQTQKGGTSRAHDVAAIFAPNHIGGPANAVGSSFVGILSS